MKLSNEEKHIKEIIDDDCKSEEDKIYDMMAYLESLCKANAVQSTENWERIDYDIGIGLLHMADGSVGCLKKGDEWYCYQTYDRNEVELSGPFNYIGVVKAIVRFLGLETKMKLLDFTEEESLVYYNTRYTLREFGNL